MELISIRWLGTWSKMITIHSRRANWKPMILPPIYLWALLKMAVSLIWIIIVLQLMVSRNLKHLLKKQGIIVCSQMPQQTDHKWLSMNYRNLLPLKEEFRAISYKIRCLSSNFNRLIIDLTIGNLKAQTVLIKIIAV